MGEDSKKSGEDGPADKYDVETAEILASEAQLMPIVEAAPIYEQLLTLYPTAAKYWKQYVEAYIAGNNDDATKQIFSRCLLNCLHIPLWCCYIRFIRKVNEKKGTEGQEETRRAFEFTLNHVGTDIASGPLWMEYIAFLKSLPTISQQEESQRMISIRKVYQRAIVTPTHHLEQLWRDYESFENSVSRQLAKGLLSEYQPKFNSARAVYRERKKYVDEIDWNIVAVPPSGSYKEEQQCLAWKRLLTFEKANPQRIESASANRRIAFTYEQCLMYLYHYLDVWYEYAMWHAKGGSIDPAIKVYQRALKALPDSESLRYAYAELEESRGAIQAAKTIYESLLATTNTTALSHIQFIRFLRRTEGVEAARKYFLDAHKAPNCTYHVYVAYALMAFCLDKDPKVAQNVFEAGLKRFMNEPGYILDYADFLCRINDDRNVRALFERALSLLSPEESVEVWKRFSQFEQTYGDLASMLKVEKRKKEALSRTSEEMLAEDSLHDLVARYSYKDLWPCSSKELDHLARQEWLGRNISKKGGKSFATPDADSVEKGAATLTTNLKASITASQVALPDISQMVIYDPSRIQGPDLSSISGSITASNMPLIGKQTKGMEEILKPLPPALATFTASLPATEGPYPDVELVMTILLQSNIPSAGSSKPLSSTPQLSGVPAPSTSDLSGSSKTRLQPNGSTHATTGKNLTGKRKNFERTEDDDTATVQSQVLPPDVFRIRQMQRVRGFSTASQTGSVSGGGSMFSGDQSGSTG